MPAPLLQIDTDPGRMDIGLIHRFLSESYWARGIPRQRVERAIAHSLCFGAFLDNGEQVGFARVISDRTTFAYLADVFVVEQQRRQGIARRLVEAAMAHPELQQLRRWMLVTRDAHALYAQFGFTALAAAQRVMERHTPDVYQTSA